MTGTYFTVTNSNLNDLNMNQAVEFFRKLLHAEARRLKVPGAQINITSNINVPDGGVDASVQGAIVQDSLIRLGTTYYQIKTGPYKAWNKGPAKHLLFGDKSPCLENLGTAIAECFRVKGTYVVVLFGSDPTDLQESKIKSLLVNYLNEWFENPKIEVFGQNKLISLLEPHLSLKLELNRRGTQCTTWSEWVSPKEMRFNLVNDEKQQNLILETQMKLLSESATCHIRILGDPGIGKTRSVLEATNHIDLRDSVLYFQTPEQYIGTEVAMIIRRDDSVTSAIVIVDECDEDAAGAIWREIEPLSRKVSLVTIFNDGIQIRPETRIAEPLSEEKIKQIIMGYGVPDIEATEWARLCDGSPRVAHVIGWNIINNPSEPLKPTQYGDLWKRFVASSTDTSSLTYKENYAVLVYCSLFRRFGFEVPVEKEAKTISEMVRGYDANITWPKFQEVVKRLKGRKILQGSKTLYITPKAFHIWLWINWWETFGTDFNYIECSKKWDEKLEKWFIDMLIYAEESRAAEKVVSTLLDPNGPFKDESFFEESFDGNFFLCLSKVNPKKALMRLQSIFESKSKQDLLNLGSGRQYIVLALENIAFKKDLFLDAAELLLRLGEAENSSYSNNATGTFTGLFKPGYGVVASSALPPLERLPVLRENIKGRSEDVTTIIVKACDSALESQHFSKVGGTPKSGLRNIDEPWVPKTWGELFSYYREVWDLLKDSLHFMTGQNRQKAVDILCTRSLQLLHYSALHEDISERLRKLAIEAPESRRDLVRSLKFELTFGKKNSDPKVTQNLQELLKEVQGDSVDDVLRRVVGIRTPDYQEAEKVASDLEMEILCSKMKENPEILDRNLAWLVSKEAENGFRFGELLYKHCSDLETIWKEILRTILRESEANVYFAAGVLNASKEADEHQWKSFLNQVAQDSYLVRFFPELVWRTKFNEHTCKELLSLLKDKKINSVQLEIFGMGGVVNAISEPLFKEWCRALLDEDSSAETVLQHFFYYYIHRNKNPVFPIDLAREILQNKEFFGGNDKTRSRSTMSDHYWVQLIQSVMKLDKTVAFEIANKLLHTLDNKDSIAGGYKTEVQNTLGDIVKNYPFETWENLKQLIDPNSEEKSWSVRDFIKQFLLPQMLELDYDRAVNEIFGWVGQDEGRRYVLSHLAQKSLAKNSITREYLIRFGKTKKDRSLIHAVYGTDFWMGPASDHFRKVKEMFEQQLKNETEPNIKAFLSESIEYAQHQIDSSLINEEREF